MSDNDTHWDTLYDVRVSVLLKYLLILLVIGGLWFWIFLNLMGEFGR